MNRPEVARDLDAAHERLAQERTLELELPTFDCLLDAGGSGEVGIDSLAGILVSARHLPDDVNVFVIVSEPTADEPEAERAFRNYCGRQAAAAWCRATTIRRAGIRQLVPCLLAAIAVVAVAAVCGTLAEGTGTKALAALLYAVGGVGVIAAWVIIWMPIEEILFDWRPEARIANAYEVLARSRVDVVKRASHLLASRSEAQLKPSRVPG